MSLNLSPDMIDDMLHPFKVDGFEVMVVQDGSEGVAQDHFDFLPVSTGGEIAKAGAESREASAILFLFDVAGKPGLCVGLASESVEECGDRVALSRGPHVDVRHSLFGEEE